MKKLDKYLLKGYLGPFLAILLIVIFVLVMQFLWVYIDELVGKGLGFKVITEFLFWGTCTILPLALPLATLLAAVMTLGQMAEKFELIAVKSAGVSLARILKPLIIAAIFISISTFFISNNLVPYSYKKIFLLREDIGKTKEEIKIPAGTFYDGIDGYVLRVDSSSENSGMMYGIMVYDHTGDKGNTTISLADSASIRMSKSKDYLTFTMYNGTNYQETNDKSFRDTSLQLQAIDFTKQEMIIRLENYAFQKSDDDARFDDQPKANGIRKLKITKDSLEKKGADAHERMYRQLLSGEDFIKRRQLDSLYREKTTGVYSGEDFCTFDNPSDERRAYEIAAENAEAYAYKIQSLNYETYDILAFLRRTDLEILVKFSTALACLLLFFIGAPLGALIRKGGLGIPAVVSALFFVLYWVVDISGNKLAKDGAISIVSGAFISAYVLAPIGIFLTWKAIRDSDLFNTDNIKQKWRKIKSGVSGFFRKTRIVYMGTPDFAVAPLDELRCKGYDVVGVVTVADKPSGRGLQVNESAVKKYAVEHNIPVLQPLKLKDPEFLQALREWKADLFVVVAFRMLPEEVWSMPRLGTFNLHAALLPQYRGAAPINWAVINGEKQTGVTTFMLDKDIDTGGIILREPCVINETDTAGDIHDRLMEMGSRLVVDTVQSIIEGSAEVRVQRSFIQGSEVLKPAPKLTRELCQIKWDDTTRHIYNLIRGLSPYPTAFTFLKKDGEEPVQLKIFFAEKMTLDSPAVPGTILTNGKDYLAIATADGALSIKDVQLAGKKRMDIKTFLLGFREPESYICVNTLS